MTVIIRSERKQNLIIVIIVDLLVNIKKCLMVKPDLSTNMNQR